MYPFINCVVYFFCCRLNPNKSDTLFLSDIKRLNGSHLDKANPVIVYLHGFSESAPGGAGQSSQELRDGNHCYIHLIANILQIETIHCILIDPLIFFSFFPLLCLFLWYVRWILLYVPLYEHRITHVHMHTLLVRRKYLCKLLIKPHINENH